MATTTLKRTVTATWPPLEACTMKVTAMPLRDVRPVSRPSFQHSKFASSLGVLVSRTPASNFCSTGSCVTLRSGITKKIVIRIPWIVRSGNLPGHVFRPIRQRGESGSRPPAASRPRAFACDGSPSTNRPARSRFGKRRRGTICAARDEASGRALNPQGSLPGDFAGDSQLPTRSRGGEDCWGRFRSSAAACARESASIGYCRAGCRSRSP
jgi:hypothetical protein